MVKQKRDADTEILKNQAALEAQKEYNKKREQDRVDERKREQEKESEHKRQLDS